MLNLSDGTRTPVGTLTGPPQAMTNAAAINDLARSSGFPVPTRATQASRGVSITALSPKTEASRILVLYRAGNTARRRRSTTPARSPVTRIWAPRTASCRPSMPSSIVTASCTTWGRSAARWLCKRNQQLGPGCRIQLTHRSAYVAVTSHAFLYRGGVMHDLGTLGGQNSVANAINNSGQIVGYSQVAPSAADLQSGQQIYHGFLYESGKMIDLNTMISATSGFSRSQAPRLSITWARSSPMARARLAPSIISCSLRRTCPHRRL